MRWGQPVTGCPFVNAPWSVYEIRVIDMENSLYIYNMVVPLRYYTYDLHSEKKESEYVMGLKQDMDWNVTRIVEQPIPDTNQIFRRKVSR